jgi:crotonobetainyl-CoA:carnitine CoA-transferase CaiB-like acyl-CoA transferase
MNYLLSGNSPQRIGNTHPNIVPYQVFKAQDDYFVLAIGNDQQFAKFCDLIGKGELKQDPRFHTNTKRVRHRQELVQILQTILKMQSRERWLLLLKDAGIPAGPIQSIADVFNHSQLYLEHSLVTEVSHPLGTIVPLINNPIHYSVSNLSQRKMQAPPVLGQHTEEILREELGLD